MSFDVSASTRGRHLLRMLIGGSNTSLAAVARAKYGMLLSGNGAGSAAKDAAQGSKPTGAAIPGAGTAHVRRVTPGTAFDL